MKRILTLRMISIYVSIILILLIIAFILYFAYFGCIGCGTQFVFNVKKGCDKINENKQDKYDLNFTLTDELLDSVIVEYGYPISGLKTGTLREFCQRYRSIEDCKREIAIYCMSY